MFEGFLFERFQNGLISKLDAIALSDNLCLTGWLKVVMLWIAHAYLCLFPKLANPIDF